MDPTDFIFPYTSTDLTTQVNRIPNSYGLIRAMGLFGAGEDLISRTVEIRREDGVLRVLPATEPGSPSTLAERETGDTIFLQVPHFPSFDVIKPQDIANMLVVAARTKRPATIDDELAKRMMNIRKNHDITLEFMRMGAVKGLIVDGNGTTLYDLYDVFGIEQTVIDFALGTAGTDVISKCDQLTQAVQTNLKGETATGIEVLVDSTFFNRFIQHANVEKYWVTNTAGVTALAQMERQNLGGQWGRIFDFQNIRWREYYAVAPTRDPDTGAKVSTPFIDTNEGHAYPVGTSDTFETFYAPPEDDIRFVNTPGEPIYISPNVLDHGGGIELKSQSNVLPLVKRPEVLVKVHSSN